MLSDSLSTWSPRVSLLILCRIRWVKNIDMPKSQIPEKNNIWTYGEHIGSRVLITQDSSEEKRIQQNLDVVGAVLLPFKGVSVVWILEGKKNLLCNSSFLVIDICTHEWVSECVSHLRVAAPATHKKSPTHFSTVVVFRETFVLWYCFRSPPPSFYFLGVELTSKPPRSVCFSHDLSLTHSSPSGPRLCTNRNTFV